MTYTIELLDNGTWVPKFFDDDWDDASEIVRELREEGIEARIVTQISRRQVHDLEGNIIKILEGT